MRARDVTADLDPSQSAAADAGLKSMIPFGRPFLDHVLHSLAEAGIRDIALVLGPEHEDVRRYYRGLETRRLQIQFVIQLEPLGTADAVRSAEEWADKKPFLALNADNLYPIGVLTELARQSSAALPGFDAGSLDLPPERLAAFAIVERDPTGALIRLVEKPGIQAVERAPSETLISMNVWRFDERIFSACRDVPLSARGERELPEAVNLAVSRGVRFEVFRARGPVLDLSQRADVAKVSRALAGASPDL